MKKDFNYPELETERLYIKLLTLDLTKEVFYHFADENITRYMDIEPCKDLQEAEEIIKYHMEDSGCRWGVFEKATSKFVGTCGYHYIRSDNGELTAEVGFDLAKAHWGKGYMREVMAAVIEYGFTGMSLYMIDATVEPENERSLTLMSNLGFTRALELQDNLVYFYLTQK